MKTLNIISSGNGLVLSGNKSVPEPMLTKIITIINALYYGTNLSKLKKKINVGWPFPKRAYFRKIGQYNDCSWPVLSKDGRPVANCDLNLSGDP